MFINFSRDLYELALKFQLAKNEQLEKENEVLLQRIKELTMKEDDQIIEELNDFAKNKTTKSAKVENEFLIVD